MFPLVLRNKPSLRPTGEIPRPTRTTFHWQGRMARQIDKLHRTSVRQQQLPQQHPASTELIELMVVVAILKRISSDQPSSNSDQHSGSWSHERLPKIKVKEHGHCHCHLMAATCLQQQNPTGAYRRKVDQASSPASGIHCANLISWRAGNTSTPVRHHYNEAASMVTSGFYADGTPAGAGSKQMMSVVLAHQGSTTRASSTDASQR